MKRLFLLAVSLIISGILSGLIYGRLGATIVFIFGAAYLPGVIFGLCAMWYFKNGKDARIGIAWAGMSIVAFVAALHVCLAFPSIATTSIYRYAIAGFVGSLILSLSTRFLITKLSWWEVCFIGVVGCVCGLIFGMAVPFETFLGNFLSPESFEDMMKRSMLLVKAFVLWQLAVGLCLGAMVQTKEIGDK